MEGNLWAAGTEGLGFYDQNTWTIYTEEDGLANNNVLAFAQEADGTMWFGTYNGATSFDGSSWQTITAEDGLPGNRISAIAVSEDGAVWFAAGANGLTRWGPPQ
ncbi:MAG: hypothetical protein JXA25_17105 [Anaerolineales bacterium]|nr:hypothetical protein [Anaerolineales bacterium]